MTAQEFETYFRRTNKRQSGAFRKIVDGELRRRGLTPAQVMGTAPPLLAQAFGPYTPSPQVDALSRQIADLESLRSKIAAGEQHASTAGDQPGELPNEGVFG